ATAKAIKTAMTTNATKFPNANPTMPGLATLITDAENAIAGYDVAAQAAEAALALRDTKVAAMCTGVMQEAGYVESVAAGDAVIIGLAGMGVRNENTPIGPMPEVEHLAVTAGDHDGTLDAMWDSIYGAKSYEICTSPDPMTESGWKFVMSVAK